MTPEIRICLFGASGRMGTEILAAASRLRENGHRISVVAGIVSPESKFVGQTLPGIESVKGQSRPLSASWKAEYGEANVIVDFSGPAATSHTLRIAAENKIPVLMGTTGLDQSAHTELQRVSTLIAVLLASNTSIGVNVMLQLVAMATKMLGESFDIELVETHHRTKKDAPSGTALTLARNLAQAKGICLEENERHGRKGMFSVRPQNEIGIHALRGGDVVGEHTVYFFGQGERIEVTHRAMNRAIFADGALRSAQWLVKHQASGGVPGLYTMADVLKEL